MTSMSTRAPTNLQPKLKAAATFNTSVASATASSKESPVKAPSHQTRRGHQQHPPDTTSDKATAALIRRVLVAHPSHSSGAEKGRASPRPIKDVLPPLTSSNEVDLQLYAFIAIIIRDFVYAWYAKITPDHVFVDEVIQVIAHCTRALEQRLRNVDLESLVFDELPALLEAHIIAYRTAHEPLHPPSIASDPHQVYHALRPHPALSPVPDPAVPSTIKEQSDNEAAYRQLLAQGALALLLPPEDLGNNCLRTLVGDIIGEIVLGAGLSGKACEDYVWWEGITKLVELLQTRLSNTSEVEPAKAAATLPATDSEASPSTAEFQDRSVSKVRQRKSPFLLERLFWQFVQYAFLTLTAMRFIIATLVSSSTRASRTAHGPPNSSASSTIAARPIIRFHIFSLTATVLRLPQRQPWLSGSLALIQHLLLNGPGRLASPDRLIDKSLSSLLTPFLSPTHLPPFLLSLRTALFPHNNALLPPTPPPSHSTRLALRRRCAHAILALFPARLADTYLATETQEQGVDVVERELDVFADPYLTRHLVFAVLDLVVLRLLPEMGEKGVEELLGERVEGVR